MREGCIMISIKLKWKLLIWLLGCRSNGSKAYLSEEWTEWMNENTTMHYVKWEEVPAVDF